MQHSISNTRLPWLVVSGAAGQIFEIPGLEMAGMRLREQRLPDPAELIPLPFGSALFQLPQRRPIGYDRSQDQFLVLDEFEGQPVFAVGAFIAPAIPRSSWLLIRVRPGPNRCRYSPTAL